MSIKSLPWLHRFSSSLGSLGWECIAKLKVFLFMQEYSFYGHQLTSISEGFTKGSLLLLNGWAEFYLQGTQPQKEKVTGSLCPKISLISLQSQSLSKAPQPGKSVLANHRSTEFSCINSKQHRYWHNHGKHHLDFLPHHTSKLSITGQRFWANEP